MELQKDMERLETQQSEREAADEVHETYIMQRKNASPSEVFANFKALAKHLTSNNQTWWVEKT